MPLQAFELYATIALESEGFYRELEELLRKTSLFGESLGGLCTKITDTLRRGLEEGAPGLLGRLIGEGLAEGINQSAEGVASAAENMARGGAAAAGDALAIQSPSKVFAELGMLSGEGYIQGINAMRASVDSAVQDLLQNPASPADDSANPSGTKKSKDSTLAAAGENGTALVHVAHMEVRSEEDIERVARELYQLTERRRRGAALA